MSRRGEAAPPASKSATEGTGTKDLHLSPRQLGRGRRPKAAGEGTAWQFIAAVVVAAIGCSSGGGSPDASGAAGTGAAGTGAAGTGTDGGMDAADGAAPSNDAGAMTLTTAGLTLVDGGLVFPAAASAPMNQSPQRAWSNAPAGTLATIRAKGTRNGL